ncbi:MAG: hypothetical protein ACQERJ_01115 [Bacillota bacterium]
MNIKNCNGNDNNKTGEKMNSIKAGLIAAAISFVCNRYLVIKLGNYAVVYLIPPAEEVIKTSAYYFIGGNLVQVHFFFGIIEAGFDYQNSKPAAFLAVITHLSFGGLTFYCWQLINDLMLAVVITISVHLAWNYLIGRLRGCD